MKAPELITLVVAAALCLAGVLIVAAALHDPAWGRSGDVAEPYVALFFMAGAASIVAGGVALVVILVRKR